MFFMKKIENFKKLIEFIELLFVQRYWKLIIAKNDAFIILI